MPTTTNRKLPYPAASEAPDGPTALQRLAEKVDADLAALFADTGWINVVPTDNRFSVGSQGFAYRRRGGFVFIQVSVGVNPNNARGTLFTLPAGFRTTRPVWTLLESNGAVQCEMRVEPSGNVVIQGVTNTASELYGYIAFPVD